MRSPVSDQQPEMTSATTKKTTTKPKKAVDAGLVAFEKARKKDIAKATALLPTDDTLASRALQAYPSLLSDWRFVRAAKDATFAPADVAAGLAAYDCTYATGVWFAGWDDDHDDIVARAYAADRAAFADVAPEHEAGRLALQLVRARFGDGVANEALTAKLLERIAPVYGAKHAIGAAGRVTSRRAAYGTEFVDDVYGPVFGGVDAFAAVMRRHTLATKNASLVVWSLRGASDDELRALFALADGQEHGVRLSTLVDAVEHAGIAAARLVSLPNTWPAEVAGASPAAYVAAVLDSAAYPAALDERLDANPCRFVVDDDEGQPANDIPLLLRAVSAWPTARVQALFARLDRDPSAPGTWWYAGAFALALISRVAVDDVDLAEKIARWQQRRERASDHCSSWQPTQRFAFTDPFDAPHFGGVDFAKRLFKLAPDDDDALREDAVNTLYKATKTSAPVAVDDEISAIILWGLSQWTSRAGACIGGFDDAGKARLRSAYLADKNAVPTKLGALFGSDLRQEHLTRFVKQKKAVTAIVLQALHEIEVDDDAGWQAMSWVPTFVATAGLKLSKDERELLVSRRGIRADSHWPLPA